MAAGVRWVSRRSRHSAASSSDDLGFVAVIHPFHPLTGQRLEVLYVKRRGAETVKGLAELAAATRAIQGR